MGTIAAYHRTDRAPDVEQSELDEAASRRVQELSVMGPEDRLHELAKMYVTIDRLGLIAEGAIWALGQAEDALLAGGEVVGGDGACDCILPGERSCKFAILRVGGEAPALPAGHVMLKRAVKHAQVICQVIASRQKILAKLQSNHQSSSKLLKGMGL